MAEISLWLLIDIKVPDPGSKIFVPDIPPSHLFTFHGYHIKHTYKIFLTFLSVRRSMRYSEPGVIKK